MYMLPCCFYIYWFLVLFSDWWVASGFLKTHLTDVTSAHCLCPPLMDFSNWDKAAQGAMVDSRAFQSLLARGKQKLIVMPEFTGNYYMFLFLLLLLQKPNLQNCFIIIWKFALSFLVTWQKKITTKTKQAHQSSLRKKIVSVKLICWNNYFSLGYIFLFRMIK